jgi:hypothetical protein
LKCLVAWIVFLIMLVSLADVIVCLLPIIEKRIGIRFLV